MIENSITLICLEEDKKSISQRFRKTDYFAFVEGQNIKVEQNPHKLSKSNQFFEYFETLGVENLYLKALGYKTFLRLEKMGVKVFFVSKSKRYSEVEANELVEITPDNAESFCSLGHF